MYLILFVLHDVYFCDSLLDAWEEAGVGGITILPSTGLARLRNSALREDIPLFPNLANLFKHEESQNRTMFTVVDDDDMVEKVLKATESVVGELNQPETGIMIVLPVAKVYGMQKRDNS